MIKNWFLSIVNMIDSDVARQWSRGWGWMLLSVLGMIILGLYSPAQIMVLLWAAVKYGFFLFLGYMGHRTYFTKPFGHPTDPEMIDYYRTRAAIMCASLVFGGLAV